MSFTEKVKGKKVLVIGLGLQGGGLGDALWLYRHGATVRVTDQKTAEVLAPALAQLPQEVESFVGGHRIEDIEWADLIIKNPGVPDNHPLILQAHRLGKPVMTSIAVFVGESPDKVIGITGTRGKSTTTELVYRILEAAYPGQVIKGGNIPGTSGLALLDQLNAAKYAVLELSSFQLHNFSELKVSPHLAVVTNIYPDHLNRYPGMAEYQADKQAIVASQNSLDYAFGNADNQSSLEIVKTSVGHQIFFQAGDVPSEWQISIPGRHNLENIAAALAVAKALNIKEELVKKVVRDFHGLPFRLEKHAVKNGITYINDTTASTPVAATIAVRAMTAPTAIIVGGQTKQLPFDIFVQELSVSPMIKKIVILGSRELPDFVTALKEMCPDKLVGQVDSMNEAVSLATQSAPHGGVVLLSPGFTSFDLFPNEFERGRVFNQAVDQL